MEDNQKLMNDDGCGSRLSENVSIHPEVTVESAIGKRNTTLIKKDNREMSSALCRCLTEDTLAVDAKWNLFVAACQSYRYNSCLKPYPPMFMTDAQEKDINSLLTEIDTVPSFLLLKNYLSLPEKGKLSDLCVELLYWLFMRMYEPSLKTVQKEHFDDVLRLVPSELSAQKPNYIFKLTYSENSPSYMKWKKYKSTHKTFFAYHGSRLENFHSIIHYGLQVSFSKIPLFGKGIYLSSELLVSLPYSLTGFGWGKSLMGPELSVVALCEVLDHPSVHCQTKGAEAKDRAMASDSIAGEVPYTYYVVSNSELIRIQYLLVYARSPPVPLQTGSIGRNSLTGWIRQHKLLSCIMGYIFLLASIGLSNNPKVVRYCKLLLNKAGMK